jgi:hypothetical protein
MKMSTRRIVLAALTGLLVPRHVWAGPIPAAKDAVLYFISPRDGQRIRGSILCQFGLRNMGVAPAGVTKPNTGHHHLLIDVEEPINPSEPIPQDKKHLHFGAGQTETRINPPPGTHTLQLALGDADHVPFDPPLVSKKIRIVVLS